MIKVKYGCDSRVQNDVTVYKCGKHRDGNGFTYFFRIYEIFTKINHTGSLLTHCCMLLKGLQK